MLGQSGLGLLPPKDMLAQTAGTSYDLQGSWGHTVMETLPSKAGSTKSLATLSELSCTARLVLPAFTTSQNGGQKFSKEVKTSTGCIQTILTQS